MKVKLVINNEHESFDNVERMEVVTKSGIETGIYEGQRGVLVVDDIPTGGGDLKAEIERATAELRNHLETTKTELVNTQASRNERAGRARIVEAKLEELRLAFRTLVHGEGD